MSSLLMKKDKIKRDVLFDEILPNLRLIDTF